MLADVGRALAALVETFETPPAPFDRFRNALARGSRITPWIYRRRRSAGRRSSSARELLELPQRAELLGGELRDNSFSKLAAPSRPDPGRNGSFKVPTLRHLLLTAPYGHHGEVETLADVVRHYSETGSREIGPLKLSAAEQSDLVVFLESISTFNNPWRPEDHGRCF